MRRLLAIPMCFATACTLTISTTGHNHNPERGSHHKITKHLPRPTPEPSPEIKERVHEQYRDIYEKINP